MATTLKQLGQVNPSATTYTTLYTVPSATQTAVSTVIICNQAATDATFRLSTQIAGAGTPTAKEFIVYDNKITANDSIFLTVGLTLGATDTIRVYASSANLSFQAHGQENT